MRSNSCDCRIGLEIVAILFANWLARASSDQLSGVARMILVDLMIGIDEMRAASSRPLISPSEVERIAILNGSFALAAAMS